MNATVRAVGQAPATGRTLVASQLKPLALPASMVAMLLLMLFVFTSALATVYIKDMNRILFTELQSLQRTSDALSVEWGQLLLEQSTWATQARTEQIAEQHLTMVMPQQKHLIVMEKKEGLGRASVTNEIS